MSNWETLKVRKEVKKDIMRKSEKYGMSVSDIIGIAVQPIENICEKCGKPFIEHAFIFTHQFVLKR